MFSQKFGLYKEYYLSRTKTSQGWVKANVFVVGFQPQFFQPSLACVLLFCSFRSRFVLSLPHKYNCQNRSWGGRLLSYTSEIDILFGHGNTPYKRICPPVPSDLATLVEKNAAGGHRELFLLQGFAFAWRPAQPLVWRQRCINFWMGWNKYLGNCAFASAIPSPFCASFIFYYCYY